MERLSEFEIGFITGLLEGEGYIGINVVKRGKTKYGISTDPEISIVIKEKEVLDWINDRLNIGSVLKQTWGGYRWRMRKIDECIKFLGLIKPFLISERNKRHVELLLNFCKIKQKREKGKSFDRNTWISILELVRELRTLSNKPNQKKVDLPK
jgi:hypothetical protein